ncbi:MAG: DUF192 domain-containing protein [Syntrophomonas sp.]
MEKVQIISGENGTVIADNGIVADTFWRRFRGLLGRSEYTCGEALLIKPCSSVHTVGMKFAIDVLFVSAQNEIIYIIEAMPARRFSPWIKNASYVVELPAGRVASCQVKTGHTLTIK